MKKIILILNALIIALLFSSCQKEVLLKKGGDWNYVYTYIYTNKSTGIADSPQEESGKISFEKDGTGSETSNGSTDNFTWSRSGSTITINYNSGGTLAYTVTEDKKNSQKMTSRIETFTSYQDRTLKLTR